LTEITNKIKQDLFFKEINISYWFPGSTFQQAPNQQISDCLNQFTSLSMLFSGSDLHFMQKCNAVKAKTVGTWNI
jgi:hypothetical protein